MSARQRPRGPRRGGRARLRQGRVALRPDEPVLVRRTAFAVRPGGSPKREARRLAGPPSPSEAEQILGPEDASLLDIVDNLLNKGVVLSGDITIGLAQVDLVYARLSLLLSAADRVLPGETTEFLERHHGRPARRDARHRARA